MTFREDWNRGRDADKRLRAERAPEPTPRPRGTRLANTAHVLIIIVCLIFLAPVFLFILGLILAA